MKVKAEERGIIDDNVEDDIKKAFPKSDHIKESQLIKILKPSLDKIKEDDIKIFNFGEGARQKLQFTQYPSVCQNNQQIFDVTGLFKTMSQVDSLAHKIGSDFLQYEFIVRKKIPLSRRSIRFNERENERNFRGQLSLMINEVKDLCDFLNKKIITEKQFNADLDELIDDFETENERNIASNVINNLLENGEVSKSLTRLRQRKHRLEKAKSLGLKEV